MGLPDLSSDQWDVLWLGGVQFPGVWTISGSGVSRKLDVKNPKGAAGASLTDEGDELALLDLDGFMWEQEQIDEFERLLPDIHPRRQGGPKTPLEIYHPMAKLLGIANIYIKQIPIPVHDKKQKTLRVSLKSIEWVPTPKVQKKGAGTKGYGAKGGADPLAELNAILTGLGNVGTSLKNTVENALDIAGSDANTDASV
jgi:hypothetical protein